MSALARYAANPDATIDVMSSGMRLTQVSAWFEFLFPDQILVPAAKLDDRLTIDVKGVRVADFITDVGLVPRREPLVGRVFDSEY